MCAIISQQNDHNRIKNFSKNVTLFCVINDFL